MKTQPKFNFYPQILENGGLLQMQKDQQVGGLYRRMMIASSNYIKNLIHSALQCARYDTVSRAV